MTTAVLIVAAGRGTRAGGGGPKQYVELAGRSVLARAVEAFLIHGGIDSITVVIHPDDVALYADALAPLAIHPGASRLRPAVHGGATRQASVLAGLESLVLAPPTRVLIHDAARPFLVPETIDRVLAALGKHIGALPGVPVADTLKRVTETGAVSGTLPRDGLWRAQTPQGFRFPEILAAHRAALASGRDFTDDAALAEWQGHGVAMVAGSEGNIKLTTAEDIARAEAALAAQQMMALGDIRIGNGFDVHRFCDGDHVMLCGVSIPHDQGLEGHSDADVGLHALTDAVFGAIGDGDIGAHFPPSDPQWKGAASDQFLAHAVARVKKQGGIVAALDLTLICERPRMRAHVDVMRQRVAEIVGVAVERISIKATTTERLGFTGREEGIAALATATVRLPLRP